MVIFGHGGGGAIGGLPHMSRSITQKVAAMNRWREQYNPLRGLTLSRAVRLAESYFTGEMADLQWTYFFVEQTDPDLLALLELRFGRLLEMDWDIVASSEADEALADPQIEFLRERFDAIDNLEEAIEHLGMASFRGFAHLEKWYTGGQLTHLEVVDQWNAVRDGLKGGWRYNPEAQSVTYRSLPAEAEMAPENFLFREVRRPINRIALFKFVRANLSEKDWDAFVEIYGIPGGVVIMPQNVPTGKEAEYEASAKAVAEGGSGASPNGADVKFPTTAARGTSPFKERLDHLSEKLVLAGTGGKLTMLTESGSGTLAGGAHAEVFDTIASAEAKRIAAIFNKQLVQGWLAERFPGQQPVAYLKIAADQETDVAAIAAEIKTLSEAGYQVDPKQVEEKTGYTVTLKPAAVPVVPGTPAAGSSSANPQSAIRDPKSTEPAPDAAAAKAQAPEEAAPAPAIANRQSKIANRGRDVLFRSAVMEQVGTAIRQDIAPVTDRLAALVAIEDEAQFRTAWAKFEADLPELQRQVLAQNHGAAEALAQAIGTALVSGYATAQQDRGAPRQPYPQETARDAQDHAATPSS